MEDFGGLLMLGFLWLVFSLMSRGKAQQTRRRPGSPLPPAPPPASRDATQREGSRLEALLREFERALEQGQATGPLGRPSTVRLPPAEEVEERDSLEAAPVVVSLEEDVVRPERVRVSEDDTAERLVARRIAAGAKRSGPLTRADHLAFDQRIRQEPADATAVRRPSVEQLRRAVVWREVLGPPVSLRDRER